MLRKVKTVQTRSTSRPNSIRRPILSVRRRLTTATPADNADSSHTVSAQTTNLLAASTEPASTATNSGSKYTRRTRPPTFTTFTSRPTLALLEQQDDGSTDDSNSTHSTPLPKVVVRRKFISRPNALQRRIPTTLSPDEADLFLTTTEQAKTVNPLFKRRYTSATTIPTISTTSTITDAGLISEIIPLTTVAPTALSGEEDTSNDSIDQVAKPSIQDSKFANNRYNQIGENFDVGEAIKSAIDDTIKSISQSPQYANTAEADSEPPITKRIGTVPITRKAFPKRRTTATLATTTETTSTASFRRRRPSKPQPFEKLITSNRQLSGRTYRPVIDYDYYDDEDERVVTKTGSQVKVVLHGHGIIECLDQGNFPHPLSCRKFISCAKMETGGVVGWEYTCPKGLSYDPVGGICNWAAGLGCKE